MLYLVTFAIQESPNIVPAVRVSGAGVAPSVYDQVVVAMKSLGVWARINRTTWLLGTDSLSASQLRDRLWSTAMSERDMLFVIRVSKEWGAYNLDPNVANWLGDVKF